MIVKAAWALVGIALITVLIKRCHGFTVRSRRSQHLGEKRVITAHVSSNLTTWCGTENGGLSRVPRHKRFVQAPSKWKKRLLSFRIENYTPDLSIDFTRLAIYHALASWGKVAKLEFYELFHGRADLMIKFGGREHGDGYRFDGEGSVLAHAFYPGNNLGGDVHFDEDEKWGLGPNKGTDLFVVAAHELGHALGLDHSDSPGALMNPLYQGYKENFQLPRDDANGIIYLYGSRGRVDPRRPTLPPLPVHPKTSAGKGLFEKNPEGMIPEPCLMAYDAVTLIRGERHVFIKRWYWRYNKAGLVAGFPAEIRHLWNTLDPAFPNIDAAFQRADDDRIVFFIGDTYYEFELIAGVANPALRVSGKLSRLGLPGDVKRVDAALTYGRPQRIVLFSGDRYWSLAKRRVGEAQLIADGWPGVPHPLDSAFSHWDGKIYFFKGYRFWEFDDAKKVVTSRSGDLIKNKWMDCRGVKVPDDQAQSDQSGKLAAGNSSGSFSAPCRLLATISWTIVYIFHLI